MMTRERAGFSPAISSCARARASVCGMCHALHSQSWLRRVECGRRPLAQNTVDAAPVTAPRSVSSTDLASAHIGEPLSPLSKRDPSPPLAVCLLITTKAKRKQKYEKNINILLGYREILICPWRVDPAGRVTPTLRLPDAAARLWLDRSTPPHPNPKGHITTCWCKMSFAIGPRRLSARFAALRHPPCQIFFGHPSLRSPASCVEAFDKSVRKLHLGRGLGMGMKTTFEAVLAALLARDNEYPSDLEQKNMVRAEFLRGAATAFALCWRGEESSKCLKAAKGLHDRDHP
jgi:hypothetical protein